MPLKYNLIDTGFNHQKSTKKSAINNFTAYCASDHSPEATLFTVTMQNYFLVKLK